MNSVYKNEQIYAINKSTKLNKTDIKKVIDCYISYIKEQVLSGRTVKFLNICYLSSGNDTKYRETKSYISTEIAMKLNLGRESVYRVLSDYEDIIIDGLKKRTYSYSIHGLLSISVTDYINDTVKVRIRKSDSLANLNIRVLTLNSFKRKVES